MNDDDRHRRKMTRRPKRALRSACGRRNHGFVETAKEDIRTSETDNIAG